MNRRQREITERLIERRLERKCRRLCNLGIMGTYNDELLLVLPSDLYWEAE